MTLYPETKCTAARAVDMIECYSGERLWMNSACDWGVSVPLAIPHAALELRRRGHSSAAIDRLIYQNPIRFLSQCPNFKLAEESR
jgi:predicted metal-dependent TIM-barrel fold hydrolase